MQITCRPVSMKQMAGAIPRSISLRYSLMLVQPQLSGLITFTLMIFALSYYILLLFCIIVQWQRDTTGVTIKKTNYRISNTSLPSMGNSLLLTVFFIIHTPVHRPNAGSVRILSCRWKQGSLNLCLPLA